MKEKIIAFIANKQFAQLKGYLQALNQADLSEIIDELPPEDGALVFRLLDKDEAADVFSRMESETQEKLINILKDNELKDIINNLYADDAADLISEMPAIMVKKILANIDPQQRKDINELLKYPEDSAGSIMTTEFVDLKMDMTVKESFDRIRKVGRDTETIYTCYVIDNARHLMGVVTVKDLLLSQYEDKIADIMETTVIKLHTLDDQEDVAKTFDKYDFLAMPVVDQEERLVGIITIDDVIDVMHEETAEDFELMGGLQPNEDSYLKSSVWDLAKHRILWLLFLMLSATFTGAILTHYEEAFSAIPLLVSFIPMLMDTGGNSGSQASTLIIRGLATGEIETRDVLKCWWKEIRVALICGVILGVVNGIRIAIQYQNIAVAVVIGLTIILVVIIAKSLGCLLPMAAKKLGLDPALMASPLITTIVDALSLLIYFNIAVFIMHI